MRRAQKLKVQAIQKEQVQLVQIEKSLEELLGNINESINSLKVEELQLKSCLVEHFTNVPHVDEEEKPTTSAQAALTSTVTSWLKSDPGVLSAITADDGLIDESINKQLLDLETLLVPMKTRVFSHDEEEEDDDDEQIVEYRHTEYEEEMDEDDEEFLPE